MGSGAARFEEEMRSAWKTPAENRYTMTPLPEDSMYINANFIITAASVITALVVIFSSVPIAKDKLTKYIYKKALLMVIEIICDLKRGML